MRECVRGFLPPIRSSPLSPAPAARMKKTHATAPHIRSSGNAQAGKGVCAPFLLGDPHHAPPSCAPVLPCQSAEAEQADLLPPQTTHSAGTCFVSVACDCVPSLPSHTHSGRPGAQVESDQLKSTDYKGPPSAIAITRPIRGLPGQCCHFLFCGKVPGETGRSGKAGSEIRHLNKTSERKQTIHLSRRLRRSASERERETSMLA